MSSTPSKRPGACSRRCGTEWSGSGSRPRPPAERSTRHNGRAATRGAWPKRPVRPGQRRRPPSDGMSRARRGGSRASRRRVWSRLVGSWTAARGPEPRGPPAWPLVLGSEWSKVRGLLQAPASFTFLDQVHDQLSRLAVAEELRAVLVPLWWLRRQRARVADPATLRGYPQAALLVHEPLCQKI